MNILSIVLRAKPEQLPAVRNRLAAMPGVDIWHDRNDGRVVFTLEDTERTSAAAAYAGLHQIDGVLNAFLIYQYCDDDPPEEARQ